MNIRISLILALFLALFLASCSNPATPETGNQSGHIAVVSYRVYYVSPTASIADVVGKDATGADMSFSGTAIPQGNIPLTHPALDSNGNPILDSHGNPIELPNVNGGEPLYWLTPVDPNGTVTRGHSTLLKISATGISPDSSTKSMQVEILIDDFVTSIGTGVSSATASMVY